MTATGAIVTVGHSLNVIVTSSVTLALPSLALSRRT
jgi:hypothetical protein